MEEVPRRTSLPPLAFLCFVLCVLRVETEGLLAGRGSLPLYGGTLAWSFSVLNWEFQYEPQSQNRQISNLRIKWGFLPIPERAPKSAKTKKKKRTFCTLLRKKCGFFRTFRRSFWNRRKPHVVAQIDYFAISALWVILKFLTLALVGSLLLGHWLSSSCVR